MISRLILEICKLEFIIYSYNVLMNPNYTFSPNTLTYLIYYYGNR